MKPWMILLLLIIPLANASAEPINLDDYAFSPEKPAEPENTQTVNNATAPTTEEFMGGDPIEKVNPEEEENEKVFLREALDSALSGQYAELKAVLKKFGSLESHSIKSYSLFRDAANQVKEIFFEGSRYVLGYD